VLWRRDIRRLDPREVAERLDLAPGDLGLLAGCPPCQGFSSVRTLNGSRNIADTRNDLVAEFARFAAVLRPRAIMLENVPGLAHDHRLDELRTQLLELGLETAARVVDAADYGVAQRRPRFMLLGVCGAPPRFAAPAVRRRTVRQAIGNLPPAGTSGDPLHDHGERRTNAVARRIRLIPADGGSRRDLPSSEQLACHRRCDGFSDIYGRMAWDDVAPTITGGCINPSKGRFLHPEADRAITLREAALLQGFPGRYFFSLRKGKFAAAGMIGNALPPGLVARHAAPLAYISAG
jgi:DNA (cytosine-5)-methyltransferase 1